MPSQKEQPPLTELEEAILERQLREHFGPTEDFWRETLLNRPMERGEVPTPLALPFKNPAPPPSNVMSEGTEDPMFMYDQKEMETKDPMPFVSPPRRDQGQFPLVSYL